MTTNSHVSSPKRIVSRDPALASALAPYFEQFGPRLAVDLAARCSDEPLCGGPDELIVYSLCLAGELADYDARLKAAEANLAKILAAHPALTNVVTAMHVPPPPADPAIAIITGSAAPLTAAEAPGAAEIDVRLAALELRSGVEVAFNNAQMSGDNLAEFIIRAGHKEQRIDIAPNWPDFTCSLRYDGSHDVWARVPLCEDENGEVYIPTLKNDPRLVDHSRAVDYREITFSVLVNCYADVVDIWGEYTIDEGDEYDQDILISIPPGSQMRAVIIASDPARFGPPREQKPRSLKERFAAVEARRRAEGNFTGRSEVPPPEADAEIVGLEDTRGPNGQPAGIMWDASGGGPRFAKDARFRLTDEGLWAFDVPGYGQALYRYSANGDDTLVCSADEVPGALLLPRRSPLGQALVRRRLPGGPTPRPGEIEGDND